MSHQPASRSALWESVDSFVALPTTNDGRLGPASRPSRSRRTHLPIASDIIEGGAFQYICANYSSAALIYYSSMGHA